MGATLDLDELQARLSNAGGTAVAPPAYSLAMGFPKPQDLDPPPAYQPEWNPSYCPVPPNIQASPANIIPMTTTTPATIILTTTTTPITIAPTTTTTTTAIISNPSFESPTLLTTNAPF